MMKIRRPHVSAKLLNDYGYVIELAQSYFY